MVVRSTTAHPTVWGRVLLLVFSFLCGADQLGRDRDDQTRADNNRMRAVKGRTKQLQYHSNKAKYKYVARGETCVPMGGRYTAVKSLETTQSFRAYELSSVLRNDSIHPGVLMIRDIFLRQQRKGANCWCPIGSQRPIKTEPSSVADHASHLCFGDFSRNNRVAQIHRVFFSQPTRPMQGFSGQRVACSHRGGNAFSIRMSCVPNSHVCTSNAKSMASFS